MGRVLASVDVGSNTVHLLIAETTNGSIKRIGEDSEWLNLGEVVTRQKMIPIVAQDRLVAVLESYKNQAAFERAEGIYVFGTEAIRSARNSAEVLDRIERQLDLRIELVSGKREAELGSKGALLDSNGSADILVLEVGGGSAQIAHTSAGKVTQSFSLPLGTGRLIAQHNISFPCLEDCVPALSTSIRDSIASIGKVPKVDRVVGCGGVARGLWRALHPDSDRELRIPELDYLIWATPRLSLDQIVSRFKVKERRASTLLPGSLVFKTALQAAGHDRMLISRFGVREGAILEMAEGTIEPCPL